MRKQEHRQVYNRQKKSIQQTLFQAFLPPAIWYFAEYSINNSGGELTSSNEQVVYGNQATSQVHGGTLGYVDWYCHWSESCNINTLFFYCYTANVCDNMGPTVTHCHKVLFLFMLTSLRFDNGHHSTPFWFRMSNPIINLACQLIIAFLNKYIDWPVQEKISSMWLFWSSFEGEYTRRQLFSCRSNRTC